MDSRSYAWRKLFLFCIFYNHTADASGLLNLSSMTKLLTLCLIHEPGRILLGMKKRGFGYGRWNGFGGKVHAGESIEDAAGRELQEEVSITARVMIKRGVLEFEFQGNPDILEVHVFQVNGYDGEPTESEEMKPQWFSIDQIPFADMWPDDIHWFPLFLAGKNFRGRFLFDERGSKILETKFLEETM